MQKSKENIKNHTKPISTPQTSLKSENSNLTTMDSVYNPLKRKVPTFPYEKRLSKIDTLQLTIAYINLLRDIHGARGVHPAQPEGGGQ